MADTSIQKSAAPRTVPDAVTVEAIRRMSYGLKGAMPFMPVPPMLFGYAFWGHVPTALLAPWLAFAVSIPIVRYVMVRWYLARELTPLQALHWARAIAVTAFVDGLVWGAAGLLFWHPDSLPHQLLLLTAIIGISTGITFVASHYPPSQYAFAIPAVGLTILGLVLQGTEGNYAIAGGFAVFLVILHPILQQAHRVTMDAIRLHFENVDLIAQLREQKHAAEQANIAKSKFLAAASHDLRQPLHALALFAAALVDKIRSEDSRVLVENMNRSISALEGLFDALLDISRLDAGIVQANVGSVRIAPLLHRLSDEYAPQARVKQLAWSCEAADLVVRTDPVLFETVLRNLIGNAITHTPRGEVRVECGQEGDTAYVRVSDTGVGIPLPHQEEVFDEFFQLHNPERDRTKGLGLGLAIVRRLTDLLGHRIELRSRPGAGTVFVVTVPLDTSPAAEAVDGSGEEADTWSAATGKVLVIDDELMVRDAMRSLLTGWGYEVVAVSSVEEVSGSGVAKADAIIADYRLRDGRTGAEAIRKLYDTWSEKVPALIITGDTSPDRLREAKKSGFALLHKPVEPARLRAFLRSALRQES